MGDILIDGHMIGYGNKPFIIAEVGQAHEGSLGLAHNYIDAAARAGVDAIKFQTHIASAESTLDEPFRVKFSRQDATRYDYWKRMEFTAEQWAGLVEHAKEKELIFLSSAFSIEAVKLLDELGMPAWKVGSGEFWSEELLDAMLKTNKPLLVSTGMSRWSEIEHIASVLNEKNHPFALFQCTSRYPTELKDVGLNVIKEIQDRIGCPAGLSDHSGTIFPSLAAIARGAALIEVHITLSRDMFGPDVGASLTPDELALLVSARDALLLMDNAPVNKDHLADELNKTRELFSKSIALTKPMSKGTTIKQTDLCAKKPGTGIPFSNIDQVVGKKLINDVPANRLLKWENIE